MVGKKKTWVATFDLLSTENVRTLSELAANTANRFLDSAVHLPLRNPISCLFSG